MSIVDLSCIPFNLESGNFQLLITLQKKATWIQDSNMETFQFDNPQLWFAEMVLDHTEHRVTQGDVHRQRQTFKQIKGMIDTKFLHGMTIRLVKQMFARSQSLLITAKLIEIFKLAFSYQAKSLDLY